MSWLGGARSRIRALLSRKAADTRTDEEIRFHLDMEMEKNVRLGMSRAQARRRALVSFGGVEQHRSEMRAARRLPLVEDVWQDVRIGLRSLRRTPGFAAVAVVILALAIGAGTAVFSVLHAVLLSPLPVEDQDRLAVLWLSAPARDADRLPVLHRDLLEYAEASRAAESVAGVSYYGSSERVLVDGGAAYAASGTWVTGNFFATLGVRPLRGRLLRPDDDEPGAPGALVVSHRLWQQRFGAADDAIGRVIEWNGKRYTIVGVAAEGFEFPAGAELWLPALPDFPATLDAAAPTSEIMVFDLVVRLARGADVERLQAELASFLRAREAERPALLREVVPVAMPLHALIVGEVRTSLWIALAAVGLLLLIACVNVANLLLIRGSARLQELAIRSSLGARPGRLLRQLLTESAVLAFAGCVFGVALAFVTLKRLLPLAPAELPRLDAVALNAVVLLFALAVTLASVLLAGLLPALVAARSSAAAWLRGAGRSAGPGRGVASFRNVLVAAQVALAVVVMAGAGLLVRSLVELQRVEMGFTAERLLVLQTAFPPELLPAREQRLLLKDAMLERVRALPGVASATVLPSRPFAAQGGWSAMYSGEGQGSIEQASNPWVNLEVVGPEYFATLDVPLRAGRAFQERDRQDAPRVAIVSEAIARQTWPDGGALGRRVKLGPPDGPGEWHTIVGVVGETRYHDLVDPQPSLYLPIRQFGGPVPLNLAVRVSTDAASVTGQVRAALAEVHPSLLLVSGGTMHELLTTPLARPRFSTVIITSLAAITLLLAVVGIHGALAATVRQRTRELGVRLALGAQAGEIRTLVLRQGLGITLAGCLFGIAAAFAAARVLQGMLFGVAPTDPATFVLIPALFLAGAAGACVVPAWRAGRVDPAQTLRQE